MTEAERAAWNVRHTRERLERIALCKIARSEELLAFIRGRYSEIDQQPGLADLVLELEGVVSFHRGLLQLEGVR